MMIKNESAAGLGRDLVPVLVYELLALGHVLLRERHLLSGYREAWSLRRGALARRWVVQSRGCASPPFGLRVPA